MNHRVFSVLFATSLTFASLFAVAAPASAGLTGSFHLLVTEPFTQDNDWD